MSRAPRVLLLVLLLGLVTLSAQAATLTVINDDDPGEGFNDPAAVAAVPGNPGTTLGQQRLNVFNAAANAWGAVLESPVQILISAEINPLFCDATSAVLGAAGPVAVDDAFPNIPRPATFFPIALANALAGSDLDPDFPDISARFNGDLDTDPNCVTGLTWWYGIGAPAPAGTLDFFNTVLHEIGHGLGFSSFVDPETGAKFFGQDDIFMSFLEDHSSGTLWPDMNNAQRAASAIDTADLHWMGSNVVAASGMLGSGAHPSGHVRMYAPNPVELGSSVSHWDTALSPDELMEPFLINGAGSFMTNELLKDIGWTLGSGGEGCTPSATVLCLNEGRFKVEVTWTDFEGGMGSGMRVQQGSDDSGLFWFFNADNWEMLIKVLTGCSINNHYWVLAAATTNVQYTLTITDTQTSLEKVYSNSLGVASPAIIDIQAFATCP